MDLILTVGTNPLPNFVVAYYFSEMEDFGVERIFLVHSDTSSNSSHSSTRSQAESVRDLLKERTGKDICELVPIKEVSGEEIYESLKRHFSEHDPRSLIHLNYTGGTKAMAVQVYSFVKDKFKENASFSYLDARDHTIKYSRSFSRSIENGKTVNSISDITLSIRELLALHGYSIFQEPETTTDDKYRESLAVIREMIKEKSVEEILDFQQNYVRSIYYDSKGYVIKNRKLFRNQLVSRLIKALNERLPDEDLIGIIRTLPYPDETSEAVYDFLMRDLCEKLKPDLIRILRNLPDPNELMDSEGNIRLPARKSDDLSFKRSVKDNAEFLGGFWFEHLINELLKDYAKKMKLQYGFSLKAKREDLPDFELDSFLMKDYRLLAISVTTSQSRILCKSKGFEVIHRSRQIGGDESRSMLVTLMDKNKARVLQDELQVESGSSRDTFVVLNRDNYESLASHIDNLFR